MAETEQQGLVGNAEETTSALSAGGFAGTAERGRRVGLPRRTREAQPNYIWKATASGLIQDEIYFSRFWKHKKLFLW